MKTLLRGLVPWSLMVGIAGCGLVAGEGPDPDATDTETGDGDDDADDDTGDPTDPEACDGDCAGLTYTACTCAPSDPCGWSDDGTCDDQCVTAGVVPSMFDDSGDCEDDTGSESSTLDCGSECADGYYTVCTCDPSDPCGWSNDSYCDEQCVTEGIVGDMFDDGGDCGLDTGSETETFTDTGLPGTWTLLFYLDADNDLEEYIYEDLNELEAATFPAGVTVLVLIDRVGGYDASDGNWTGTRLYRLETDDDPIAVNSPRLADPTYLGLAASGDSDELNMGDGDTLAAFVDFAQANYPAEHRGLFLSDHGEGWYKKKGPDLPGISRGLCYDETSGDDSLSNQTELPAALSGHHFDVIGFDACVLGMIENAWALKDLTDWFIASEASIPGTGWDYASWINTWGEGALTAQRLAATAVSTYSEFYSWYDDIEITLAATVTSGLDEVGAALDTFLASTDPYGYLGHSYEGMPYYDLGDIAANAGDSALTAALEGAVIYEWHTTAANGSNGLSIYWGDDYGYSSTAFCLATDWC